MENKEKMNLKFFPPHFRFFILHLLVNSFILACTYQMGYINKNQWLKKYKGISIPVFKNNTQYGGVEVYFTDSLIQEFEKSKVTPLISHSSSQLLLIGSIEEIRIKSRGFIDISNHPSKNKTKLSETVLASNYDIQLKVNIKIIEKYRQNVTLWEKNFNGEKIYQAPQIGLAGINSSNPLYNHKVRLNKIKELAEELMLEAHDSIVEQF